MSGGLAGSEVSGTQGYTRTWAMYESATKHRYYPRVGEREGKEEGEEKREKENFS